MTITDQRIIKAREQFNVDVINLNIPDNIKQYIVYLEIELLDMMYEAEYWCEKYVNEKDESK